ncbi:MAG: hypothetical protein AAF466_00400 [Bacteroidota bacterium]
MKLFSLLCISALLLVSCAGSGTDNNIPQILVQDTIRYGKVLHSFPRLTTNANEQIENWSVYYDFYNEVSTLYDIDLPELRAKTDRILAHTDSLSKKIPDTLNTSAIYSRLIIVDTRVKLLQQEANKGIVDIDKVEENITETNDAVENLIIQLNEKFQKDGIDLERIDNEKKELEKQKKFLDSVYQAELRDQKKDSL